MSGPASTWVPPAGLYIENSKKGLGNNMWELRDGKVERDPDEWVAPPEVRDPEKSALRAKHVKQITRPMVGFKSTWVPPAGLYTENQKKGLNIDMWELKNGKRPNARSGKWISHDVRDPDACALKAKHVKQITAPLSGPVSTWKPPAGLYIENSKKGLNVNMWELLRSKQAEADAGEDATDPLTDPLLVA